jgi:N-dimethylarginine dimethylaminohydrolase
VGRPHYRIPSPLPPERKAQCGAALWRRAKRVEGMTLREAMPTAYRRCREQIDRVVRLLRRRGVTVHRLPPFLKREETPRRGEPVESILLFPRDPFLVVGGHLLELAPVDPKRRRERGPIRRLLDKAHPGIRDRAQTLSLPGAASPCRGGYSPADANRGVDDTPAFLDGGDCLVADHVVFVGMSPGGTNAAGVAWLSRVLGPGWRVHTVAYDGPFPHLDCTLCLVRPGLGLFCPKGLPGGPPAPLARWTWIEVDAEEALGAMATNGLQLDPHTLLLPETAYRTAAALESVGHQVLRVPFDTVTDFGGGLRCWSQPLVRAE